jgi:dethiobiotin synthetase
MKPFCTGERGDVRLLQSLQPGLLRDDEVNPVWLRAPLAPHFAALRQGQRVNLSKVREAIDATAKRCDQLLMEGAGGVLVPLTRTATVADFIADLGVETLVVAPNRIGVINQVGLTVEALRKRGVAVRKVVLMDPAILDPSCGGNAGYVRKTLAGIEVFRICHLGENASQKGGVERAAKKLKKVLAGICGPDIVCPRSLERFAKAGRPSADKKTKKSR